MQVYNVTGKFGYLGRNLMRGRKSLAIWEFPFHVDVRAEILSAS